MRLVAGAVRRVVQKFRECFSTKVSIILGEQDERVPRCIHRVARHAEQRAWVGGDQLKPHAQALQNRTDLLAGEMGIHLILLKSYARRKHIERDVSSALDAQSRGASARRRVGACASPIGSGWRAVQFQVSGV